MGLESEQHIEKAVQQLVKGLEVMSNHWDPDNAEVTHRYWLNQLYRAIIFSPINLPDNSSEYSIIREKIYKIIDGKVDIKWSGDVFAFWLDNNSEMDNEVDITLEIINSIGFEKDKIESVKTHEFGQLYIQKMLLPIEKRDDVFEYNDVVEYIDEGDEDDELTAISEPINPVKVMPSKSTIPQAG